MKRKINLVGSNTLTVSLPSKWTKKYGLKKGDELSLLEKGNKLIINPESITNNKSITIDATDISISSLWRLIKAAYCLDYNEIIVKFDKPYITNTSSRRDIKGEPDKLEMYFAIRNIVDRLTTVSIVEHLSNKVIIKETSKPNAEDFNVFLKRIIKLLQTTSNQVYDSLLSQDINKVKNIFYLDDEINSYVDICTRLLNKGVFDENKASLLLSLITYLERIGDTYMTMLKINYYKKIKLKKDTVKYFETLQEIYNDIFNAIFSNSNINDVHVKTKNLKENIFSEFTESNVYLIYIRTIVENLEEMIQPIYGLRIILKL